MNSAHLTHLQTLPKRPRPLEQERLNLHQEKKNKRYSHGKMINEANPAARMLQEQERLLLQRLPLFVHGHVFCFVLLVHGKKDWVEILRTRIGGGHVHCNGRGLLVIPLIGGSPFEGRWMPLLASSSYLVPLTAPGLPHEARVPVRRLRGSERALGTVDRSEWEPAGRGIDVVSIEQALL